MDLILASSVFIFLAVFALLMVDIEDNSAFQQRLNRLNESQSEAKTSKKEDIKNFLMMLFKPLLSALLDNKNKQTIRDLMLEAGLTGTEEEILKFTAKRLIYAGIGLVIGLLFILLFGFNSQSLLIVAAGPIGLYILPVFGFKGIARKRTAEITYNLPDALDLLTICVGAGLGLDAALSRVAKEFKSNSSVLSEEFDRVSKDIMAGISRQDAFRNLAARNNVPDLQSLAALLIQADKLGTSISQALRVYSDTIRTKRKQRVEELANKASIKMVVPLVFFVLPAMFVVILAPAAISMVTNMK